MAMFLDYKLTRYEGKGFLKNLNIRIHRDITGEMWFGVGVFSDLFIKTVKMGRTIFFFNSFQNKKLHKFK